MARQQPTTALATVEAYLSALNAHDLDAAGALLSDEATLTFIGPGFRLTKPQILDALGWDVGANGRFAHEVADAAPNAVVIELSETNAFLELLGLEPLQGRMTFTVGSDELIGEITYESTGASADPDVVRAALAPAVRWAQANAPDELAAVYPEGQIRYSRASAERWVALLTAWRESEPAQ